MDDVSCRGTEPRLTACTFTSLHNCVHHEDAGVHCQPPSTYNYAIKMLVFLCIDISSLTASNVAFKISIHVKQK